MRPIHPARSFVAAHSLSRFARIVFIVACCFCLGFGLAGCTHAETVENDADTFNGSDVSDSPVVEEEVIEEVPAEEPVAEPEPAEEPAPAASTGIVTIDAGHQGAGDSNQEPVGPGASETKARVTSGTSGVSTGIDESEITLAVAFKLRTALEERGVTVVMCRDTQDINISNSERAAIANEAGSDLFIRLHCDDTGESSTSGFYTLVPGENQWTGPIVDESNRAAQMMHPMIVAALGVPDRGITPRTDLSGFNWCEVPTVLFEMGCMSNPAEDERLASEEYQWQLANAIADATVAYLNS